MKFLKSLPARLLLAIAVGILMGFVLPEDAMKVIVTLKLLRTPRLAWGFHATKKRRFLASLMVRPAGSGYRSLNPGSL